MEPTLVSTNPITDSTRTMLYNELCDAMVEGLRTNLLELDSAQDSANYILQLDNIKTYQELVIFVEQLSQKWPAYQVVLNMVKEVEAKVADEKVINNVLEEIKKYQ